MRILTFLHSFEPGGVERVALRLVRHWRGMGVDAPLFLGREDGALRHEFARDLEYAVPRQPGFGTAWWETLWMILRLPGEIRRTRPHVLFVAGSTYTIVAVAMRLILGSACPPVVAKISNDLARNDLPLPARLAWRAWLAFQTRFARIWVIMDEAIVGEVQRGMAKRCWVIHDPAISEAQILPPRPARPRSEPRRFVAVGRLAGQKDYPLMLRAFARRQGGPATLTIFGDGAEREGLAALARDLGITDAVTFAGHVADAPTRLPDFDTLLLSSRYEGVPAVIVEALAAGLEVVATDCGAGVRSLLGDGRYGRIVPRNPVALGDAIGGATILLPPPREAVLAHIRRFTIEHSARLYLEAFEEAFRPAVSHKLSLGFPAGSDA